MIWPRRFYLLLFYLFAHTTPRGWQYWQNELVTPVVFRLWKRMRAVLQGNLAVVLGRSVTDPLVRHKARRLLLNYALYLIDYSRFAQVRRYRHMQPAEECGENYMREALAAGRGAILVTPHLGNYELGGVLFAQRGHPIHALTLRDPEETVQGYRDWMRTSLGIETVHMEPPYLGTMLKLVKLLEQNQVVVMLGDRYEGGKQIAVTFFGRRVIFPAGATALALASRAPVIPAFCVLAPRWHYRAWMEPPIYVRRKRGKSGMEIVTAKTQELAGVFERAIARHPDQWFHFFDYWGRYGC